MRLAGVLVVFGVVYALAFGLFRDAGVAGTAALILAGAAEAAGGPHRRAKR